MIDRETLDAEIELLLSKIKKLEERTSKLEDVLISHLGLLTNTHMDWKVL